MNVNVISKSKLLANLDRVTGERLPITADVFLTNYCNNHCSWCTYGRWQKDHEPGYMRFDVFRRILKRLLEIGVRGVILTGGGEPTINPDFERICEELSANAVPFGINTNFNEIRFVKPAFLKVSLDGYSDDSYAAIRKVHAYDKVRKNIRDYAEWKEKESPMTKLGIQMVVCEGSNIDAFYQANVDLPVDYIVFRPVESTGGCYYSTLARKLEAEKAVEKIKELAAVDERIILNFKWEMLTKRFDSCKAHWAQISVDERGNVIYCFHKPYEKIGSIFDPGIMEVYQAAVTDMGKCDIPCRLTAPNLFMEGLTQKNTEHGCFI